MSQLSAARERTDAKLQYAGVHLQELKARRLADPSQGGAWERAHQESYLFQLMGVRDALLQEINLFHSCGLSIDQVRKADLKMKLLKLGKSSPALDTLIKLENDKMSWIMIASRLRHFSMHQRNVPQQFYKGGDKDGMVFLKDPLTNKPIETDYLEVFSEWFDKMAQLVSDLRTKMPGAENA